MVRVFANYLFYQQTLYFKYSDLVELRYLLKYEDNLCLINKDDLIPSFKKWTPKRGQKWMFNSDMHVDMYEKALYKLKENSKFEDLLHMIEIYFACSLINKCYITDICNCSPVKKVRDDRDSFWKEIVKLRKQMDFAEDEHEMYVNENPKYCKHCDTK